MAQYIDKDALVEEIERRKSQLIEFGNTFSDKWACGSLDTILSFLDTLEVKEVDLEKEIDDWYNTIGIPVTTNALKETASHFFELGFKATQKGE